MKLHAKIALFVTVAGFLGLVAWWFLEPILTEQNSAKVSDVGELGTIRIGVDGWVGYFPLCSPEMKRRLNREGYGLVCTDDAANYDERFNHLKDGHYDFAVATVDSYLLNGEKYSYPGPIVTVIDESKGGDAIVANKAAIPSLEALKKKQTLKVAFTPASPSEHLLKAVSTHFDISSLRKESNHVESEGSEDALKRLLNSEVDLAVLWEPEVSKALENDSYVRILGTEDTQQLIVDILIANHRMVQDDPQRLITFMKSYFKTLKHYRDHQEELIEDISDHYDIKTSTAEALLKGVRWATMVENAERWYGISGTSQGDALVETIDSAVDILLEHKDFRRNPIPNQDAYRLVYSKPIESLYQQLGNVGSFTTPQASATTGAMVFSQLSASQWEALQEVGSLKTRKIAFASGTASLTIEGKRKIDELMEDLKHYPNFRVEVRGHTGLRGDPEANKTLSEARAKAVARYIEIAHTIEDNRMRAIGFGSEKPLPKLPGESSRAYNYRLPRVEIALVREVF